MIKIRQVFCGKRMFSISHIQIAVFIVYKILGIDIFAVFDTRCREFRQNDHKKYKRIQKEIDQDEKVNGNFY